MRRVFLGIVYVFFAIPAYSATHTATSCNLNDVKAALLKCVAGDIAVIPAGTCRWTSPIDWDAPPNVMVVGAGSLSVVGGGDATILIDDLDRTRFDTGILNINTHRDGTFRLAGITVRGTGNPASLNYNGSLTIGGETQALRVDHMHFDRVQYVHLLISGQIYGVVDHSVFDLAGGTAVKCFAGNWGGAQYGDGAFADETGLGSHRFVFVEDNVFNAPTGSGGVVDSYLGSRFVVRYNTINGSSLTTHPTGGSNRSRGTRAWEVYGNRTNTPNSQSVFSFFFISSGTGVIWGNHAATGYRNFVTFHAMRRRDSTYRQAPTPEGWGYAGTAFNGMGSNWDGNENPATGYPNLDQPGRGKGDLLSGDFPSVRNTATGCDASQSCAYPRQALEPIYEWDNTWSRVENEPGELFSGESDLLLPNRDYYLAAKKPDYQPFAYPHPLTVTSAPEPPRNLRVIKN